MTRFVQIHALTIYAPSNLNRDDTGRPKTAKFGGAERLRISSQALKRAIRTSEAFRSQLASHRGERTQRLGDELRAHLIAKGQTPEAALNIARQLAGVFGKLKAEGDANPAYIEQLAFVSPEERQSLFALADAIASGAKKLPAKTEDVVADILRKTDTAADIAMFGRMLADNPEFNREAAVQVAHAITTHRVEVESDFYTAVDDLKKPSEDAGAGFIGELGFGSGVFYLYACVDRTLLLKNLGDDKALAAKAIAGLVEGLATASPSGKQASFAARSRASYLRVEAGSQQPRSLAAAFFKPVRGEDLFASSVAALTDVAAQMDQAYGKCCDSHYVMNVAAKQGALAEAIAFAVKE